MRLLVATLEFTYAPFSGNGLLARAIAQALLRRGCTLAVLCARPHASAANHHLHADAHIHVGAHTSDADALELYAVELPADAAWRRLDRGSAWEAYADGAAAYSEQLRRFRPDAALVVDWSGASALLRLDDALIRGLPIVYLNFRVFSAGLPSHEGGWYDAMERRALAAATLSVALSARDERSLRALSLAEQAGHRRGGGGVIARAPRVYVLHPPLRSAMHELATARGEAAAAAPSASGRLYLSCVVRLSREKEPMRFVELIRALKPALDESEVVPLLCGASSDAEYAAEVKRALAEAAPRARIVDDFLGAEELADVFAATVLNFHPCAYDAYGMSVIEAAAFGAPSVINGGGNVGAGELLSEGGTAIEVDFGQPHDDLARTVGQLLLGGRTTLARVGEAARRRVLEWGEDAHGAALHAFVEEAIALQRVTP